MKGTNTTVLVVDENKIRAAIIEAGLREAGYEHVHVVGETFGLARYIENISPDVIVIDLENPNRDLLESMFQLSRTVRRPIAMFVDKSDQRSIEAAVEAGVSAYIVDGLTKERVKPILDMAISRFNAFAKMSHELQEARDELAGRRVVERAKGILMKARNIGEEEAYQLLRRTAMSQNRKISDIAQSLITAKNLFNDKK